MAYFDLASIDRGGIRSNGKTSLTLEQAAERLTRDGLSWGITPGDPATVSYAFRSTAPSQMPDDAAGFSRLDAAQIEAVERALQLWSDVANIRFVRVGSGTSGSGAYSNNATILFGGYGSGVEDAAAFAYLPGSASPLSPAGDVWVNRSLASNQDLSAGRRGFMVLVHEIGHAIGLTHPGDYDAGDPDLNYATVGGYFEDSLQYSLMSYFDADETGGNAPYGYLPGGPLMDDIAAVQRLYGANSQSNLGNTVYGENDSSEYFQTATPGPDHLSFRAQFPYGTIWDSGGIDTIDFGVTEAHQKIDLRPGAFSDVMGGVATLSIAPGVIIENAIGGRWNDVLIGNVAANLLVGNSGDDSFVGGLGDDTLVGGGGYDRAAFAATYASVTFSAFDNGDFGVRSNDGIDTLSGIEAIDFSDRALTTDGLAGIADHYRTYMGRSPQSDEIGFWLGQLDQGGMLDSVKQAIVRDAAGAAYSKSVIAQYYQTYLGREAQQGELTYWHGTLGSGETLGGIRSAIAADWSAKIYYQRYIADRYDDYLDRSPNTDETSFWTNQIASTASFSQLYAGLAEAVQWSGRSFHLMIREAYEYGLGRDPVIAEIDVWQPALRAGLPLEEMRRIIGNDSPELGKSTQAVTSAYLDLMGRAPTSAELSYWDGQARAGGSLEDVREAIVADGVGRAHLTSSITGIYREYAGRPPSSAEIDTWLGLMEDGATPENTLVAVILDEGNDLPGQYSAFGANQVVALPANFGHVVVQSFLNDEPSHVTSGDRDRLDLRAAGFAGLDPLDPAYAREVMHLNGGLSVLITLDTDNDILIAGMSLDRLSDYNFIT